MSDFFTNADIDELRANPSEYVKLNLIGKIAHGYDDKQLSSNEKTVAGEILNLLAQDISTRIRMNISEKFCNSEEIPYEVIKKLAEDVEDLVAIPMVQFSNQLTENDLVEIIKKDRDGKQRAVARREKLSEKLVDEIITHGTEYTVEALVDTNASKLSPENSKQIISKFNDNEAIINGVVNISKARPEVMHDLLSLVSEGLRKEITLKYNIPTAVIDSLVSSSKESVAYNMLKTQISKATSDIMLESIIAKLKRENQLSLNLIIKILGTGNTNFFFMSLGKLASIPSKNAEQLVEDEGYTGITKLFEKAQLQPHLANAVKTLYRVVQKEIADNPKIFNHDSIINRLEERVKTSDDSHLRYVLNIIKTP